MHLFQLHPITDARIPRPPGPAGCIPTTLPFEVVVTENRFELVHDGRRCPHSTLRAMDEAFRQSTVETELAHKATVLMGGYLLKNKRGHVLITNDRVLFTDQRFNPTSAGAVGGPLAGLLAEALEHRRKGRPPLLDFPLTDITRVSHVTKLTVRDILIIEAEGEEHRFSEGYGLLSPLLRRALTERHGRVVIDDGPDTWRVTG
jgi:hypothetical protein